MEKILFLIATISLTFGIYTPNPEESPEIG